jgi:hypothetical protein
MSEFVAVMIRLSVDLREPFANSDPTGRFGSAESLACDCR